MGVRCQFLGCFFQRQGAHSGRKRQPALDSLSTDLQKLLLVKSHWRHDVPQRLTIHQHWRLPYVMAPTATL